MSASVMRYTVGQLGSRHPARRRWTWWRIPLEQGEIRLAWADGTIHYPARFQLLVAANPCPCAPAHDCDWVPVSSSPRPGDAEVSSFRARAC